MREFSDPIARALLPDGWLWDRGYLHRPRGRGAILAPLRTVAIDGALRQSVEPQLVVLGAGLDSRAWRMTELAASVVYEVDHPVTQAYKAQRTAALKPCAREVRFVPVDFEHDRLEQRLAAAGHEAFTPTFWIWEGVIPYLRREAFLSTLAAIAARSARASKLAATYGDRQMGWLPALLGEPFRSVSTPEQMAQDLSREGWHVLSDTNGLDWAKRWSQPPGGRTARYLEERHLVVAERRDL